MSRTHIRLALILSLPALACDGESADSGATSATTSSTVATTVTTAWPTTIVDTDQTLS